MVVDFQEELVITRTKDQKGKPHFLPFYDLVYTKTDLADDTTITLDKRDNITLGEACQAIDDFGGSELIAKARIYCFLESDTIHLIDQY